MQNSSELLHYIRFLLKLPYGVGHDEEHRPRNRQARCADARTRCRRLDLHRRRPVRPPDRCRPLGSVSQMAHIRLGTREEGRNPLIKDFAPSPHSTTSSSVAGTRSPPTPSRPPAPAACSRRGSLPHRPGTRGCRRHGRRLRPDVGSRLEGTRVKSETNKWDQAMALMADIENFKVENGATARHGLVRFDGGLPGAVGRPRDRRRFEQGLKDNDDNISPSQIYVYAALRAMCRSPTAPNLSTDLPCMQKSAHPRCPDRWQGFQDGPDPHEDPARPRPQGPHARSPRLVLDQHPWQPRR